MVSGDIRRKLQRSPCHCNEAWCKAALESGQSPLVSTETCAKAFLRFPEDKAQVLNWLKACTRFVTDDDMQREADRIISMKKSSRPRLYTHHFLPSAWEYRAGKRARDKASWVLRGDARGVATKRSIAPPPFNAEYDSGAGGRPVCWNRVEEPLRKRQRTVVPLFSPPPAPKERSGVDAVSPVLVRSYLEAKKEADECVAKGDPVPAWAYLKIASHFDIVQNDLKERLLDSQSRCESRQTMVDDLQRGKNYLFFNDNRSCDLSFPPPPPFADLDLVEREGASLAGSELPDGAFYC